MHSDIYLLGTEVLLTDHCYFEVSCTLEYRAAPNPSKSLPPSLVAIPTLHLVLNPVSHQPAEATVILYNFQLRLPTLKFGSWSLCSRSTNVDSVVVPPPVWVWDIPNPKLWFMKLLWQMHKCWCVLLSFPAQTWRILTLGDWSWSSCLHRWTNVDYMIISVADYQLPHIQIQWVPQKTHIHDESPKTRTTLQKNLHQHPQQSSMGCCYIHEGTELWPNLAMDNLTGDRTSIC